MWLWQWACQLPRLPQLSSQLHYIHALSSSSFFAAYPLPPLVTPACCMQTSRTINSHAFPKTKNFPWWGREDIVPRGDRYVGRKRSGSSLAPQSAYLILSVNSFSHKSTQQLPMRIVVVRRLQLHCIWQHDSSPRSTSPASPWTLSAVLSVVMPMPLPNLLRPSQA